MKAKDKLAQIPWLQLVAGKVPDGFENVLSSWLNADKEGVLSQVIDVVARRVDGKGLIDVLKEIPDIVDEIAASDIDADKLTELLEVDCEPS